MSTASPHDPDHPTPTGARPERCGGTWTQTWPCWQGRDHDGGCGPREWVEPRVADPRAAHTIPSHLVEETCPCGQPAAHKVEETSGPDNFHPLTGRLCCEHFNAFVGHCGSYPYDLPETRFSR